MADDEDTNEETNDEAKDETNDEAEDSGSAESGGDDSGGDTAEEAVEDDDPEFGKKDDEPVNDVQMKYLEPLAEDQGEEIPDNMSEADAADKIDEMQENASG